MYRLVSLAVVLTLIVVLGITFFKVVAPFLLPLFVAGMTVILAQPLFRHFVERTHGRVRLAAGLTTAAIVGLILIPLITATAIASMQLYAFALDISSAQRWEALFGTASGVGPDRAQTPTWLATNVADFFNQFLPDGRGIDATKLEETVRTRLQAELMALGDRSLGLVTGVVSGVVFSVLSATIALFIYAIALYYFFADGTALLGASQRLIPVHGDYQRQMLNQFSTVVRSVVSATFLAALTQALAVTAALWLCGFGHLITLFMLSLLSAMIPVAGTWLIWGPAAVILAAQGQWGAATVLVVYGAAVVGVLDNVVRTYILNADTKLHPLLALISVLGGLQVMGLWGVFIGPIIASCLHALIKIFNLELAELSRLGENALAATHAAAQAGLQAVEEATDPATGQPASAPVVTSARPEMTTQDHASGNSGGKKGKRRKGR
jgi:predicted PurR-regulated permease PerM